MASEIQDGAAVACPNISLTERRRRLGFGVVMLLVGAAVLVALMAVGASRWWRFPLLLIFYPAALGYFQYADHTCVALAARSERKTGERVERIEDADDLARVRAQARRVQAKSLLAGVGLLVVALVV